MKLTALFLTLALTHAFADSHAQKVTLSGKDLTYEQVFGAIEKQTGYVVLSNKDIFTSPRTVSLTVYDMALRELLDLVFTNQPFTYNIEGKTIFILKKGTTAPKLLPDTVPQADLLKGLVKDTSGVPLVGATVMNIRTKQSKQTNAKGEFSMEGTSGDVLLVSFIGFLDQRLTVQGKSVLVVLQVSTSKLDEVQIIAYGKTTKRLNTGNIASLKADEIERQPVTNALLAIQGRVPGVMIQQATGLPNSGVTIKIQGLNSLRSGNDPFFVIDGVPFISQLLPINNSTAGSSSNSGISGNPLNFLNPGDIESIEVLKDADATAIYGSRAANGAVLITTKKGKAGETQAEITLQNGWGKVGHMLDLLNTQQYLEMRHEALRNDGITTPSEYDYDLNGAWDTTRNTDWQKELIGNAAQFTNAQINLSGGSELTQFFIGGGFNKQTTVFPGDFSDVKGSLHFSITNTSSSRKFKTKLSASYMYDKNKASMVDFTGNAIALAPLAPKLFNPDGTVNWERTSTGAMTYYANPYNNGITGALNPNTNITNNLTSNLVMSYELMRGLEVKTSIGYNSLTFNEITLQTRKGIAPEDLQYSTLSTITSNNKISSWVAEPQIEYKRNINRGNLNFLLGGTLSQKNSDQSFIVASGFSNELLMRDLASATSMFGSSINSIYKYVALSGRLTYNWIDKYIINLTARRDGSSRFGAENQFHNFGSIGAAWVFSQEPVIRKTVPFLSFGKLRGSYGTMGNDQIPDYLFLDLYRGIMVGGPLYQNAIGLRVSNLTNPYLQWEETKKLQFGLELGFMKDKVLFTINYNQNRSSNQLLSYALPIVAGFQSITRNFPAVIQNTGWEFTLNTTNVKSREFTWLSSINLTLPKNRFLSFAGADNYQGIMVGQPITMQRLFNYAGLNETTGLYEYKDSKGNNTATPSDPIDKISFVSPDPKLYGGFQNSLSYKRVSLDFLFTFCRQEAQDNITYGMNGYYPGTFNYGRSNQATTVLNRWQKPGDKAALQPYSSNGSKDLYTFVYSDAVWSDASYIKLKNVSVSWQMPEQWSKKMRIRDLRLFMNAQNLFTATKYKGFDPEVVGLGLPPLRVITFGVKVSL